MRPQDKLCFEELTNQLEANLSLNNAEMDGHLPVKACSIYKVVRVVLLYQQMGLHGYL